MSYELARWRGSNNFHRLPRRRTFLGILHAFLPHERLLTWAEKNVDQSQQTSKYGKCTFDLEKFRAWLYSFRKDQKGRMKGEDLTVLEQTTQLTDTRSYSNGYPQNLFEKITSEIKVGFPTKKILPFVQYYKVTTPLHPPKNNFMSKWHLI